MSEKGIRVVGNLHDKKIVAEALASLLIGRPDGKHNVENLSHDNPLYTTAKRMESLSTGIVNYLRGGFPNPNINKLGAIIWDLIGRKITPCAIGPNVTTVSFVAMGNYSKGAPGAIFLPHKWLDLYAADPIFQAGAFVFCGSQAMDYYNDKLIPNGRELIERAQVYEAEYLHTVARHTPDWKPNEYQQTVMRQFPQGVGSEPKPPLYASKPVVPRRVHG